MTKKLSKGIYNIGTGFEISIEELAYLVMDVIGVDFNIRYDKRKPDGVYSKILDCRRIKDLGWKSKINLKKV